MRSDTEVIGPLDCGSYREEEDLGIRWQNWTRWSENVWLLLVQRGASPGEAHPLQPNSFNGGPAFFEG